jgi:hypothetical protein
MGHLYVEDAALMILSINVFFLSTLIRIGNV